MIDTTFAKSLGIGIANSNELAQAANRMPLDVYGQTQDPISFECPTETGSTMIHLGILLVVTNLGTSCLIGEPAKKRNNIICLPRHKMILLGNGNNIQCARYAEDESKHTLVRAVSNFSLAPGDQLLYKLPDDFKSVTCVAATPRTGSMEWLRPTLVQPVGNAIYLTNSSTMHIDVRKADHIADVRNTKQASFPQKVHFVNVEHSWTWLNPELSVRIS